MANNISSDALDRITPCDHAVQIYNDPDHLIDRLARYVSDGINAGEGVVIIATGDHRNQIESRVSSSGIDLEELRLTDQYIALDADEILTRFMVHSWPDTQLFTRFVDQVIGRARGIGRRVRAYGEMVALLWERGEEEATLRLEQLWHRECHARQFSLFCAYPHAGFTRDADTSIAEIFASHSRVIAG